MKARALVLDTAHRVLLVNSGGSFALLRAETTPGSSERPMQAVERAARERLGIELGYPCGARPLIGAAFDFVYLVAANRIPALPESVAKWVPLRTVGRHAQEDADAVWSLYTDVMLGGFEPPRREIGVFAFGSDPEMAALLAHYVVKGTKRATADWLEAAKREGELVPWPGLPSIVTDGFGIPICCIQTERVEQIRFGDVGEEVARAEGEGDRSLDDWRDVHRRYFTAAGARLGLTFDDDAIVMVDYFKLLKVFARG